MEGLMVIIEKIAYIGIMILIGFLCEKTGFVKNITQGTSGIIKNITLPCLLITSVSGNVLDSTKTRNGLMVCAIGLVVITLMMGIGNLTAKLFKLDNGKRGIQISMGSFGNVAFLGFPLIHALLGDEGILYAVFYHLANDGLLWSFGLSAISGEKGIKKLKNMVNVCTIAFAVGLAMLIAGVKLSGVLNDSVTVIGNATTPLSMLFIGATMAKADILSALKKPYVYILTFTKMIFVPACVIFALSFLPAGFMSITAATALILQIAMPSQTLIAILAKEYSLDEKYAVEVIFITTLFSMISLPCMYKLAEIFLR